jgi:hypothetical protein
MRYNNKLSGIGALCAGVLGLGVMAPSVAHAAYPTEVEIFLLDASGSMLGTSKMTGPSNNVPVSKWDEVFNQVSAKLHAQGQLSSTTHSQDLDYTGQNKMPVKNHCIAVWAFADNWLKQVYPMRSGAPFAVTITNGVPNVTLSDFRCAVDTDHSTDPTASTLYDQIGLDLAGTVQNRADVKPQNGGPSTPLAKNMCIALHTTRTIQASSSTATRRLVLMSDGAENSTPSSDECGDTTPSGTTRKTFVKDPVVNGKILWAGGVLDTQWEMKTYNVAIYDKPLTSQAPLVQGNLNDRNQNESFDTFLARVFPPNFAKRVAVDAMSMYDYVPTQVNITPALQAMFTDLAVKTKGSAPRFQYGASYPVPLPGVDRVACKNRIQGDVDCSGVVNIADIQHIYQSDMWRLPVVLSYDVNTGKPIYHKHRNEGDLNRDGMVNGFDEDIVYDNWGNHI